MSDILLDVEKASLRKGGVPDFSPGRLRFACT